MSLCKALGSPVPTVLHQAISISCIFHRYWYHTRSWNLPKYGKIMSSEHIQFQWPKTWYLLRGWVGLWGFLWWAPSAKRKDHHGVSSGWSSVWHRSNTGLSSTQYEQIAINYTWGLAILADSLLFSVNSILAGLWLNCISSVEISLFLLADILLQHRALFQC